MKSGTTAPINNRQRIKAIVASSSGNLVEWYDFYAYSFLALYFAPAFFPKGDQTTQLLAAAGVFAVNIDCVGHTLTSQD